VDDDPPATADTADGGDYDNDDYDYDDYDDDYGVAATYAPILDETLSSYRVGWVQLGGRGGRSCVMARDHLTPESSAEQAGIIMCCRDVDDRR